MIDQNDPRLTAFVLGELSSSEAAEIKQAISDSPELAAAVEEIRGMVGLLGDAYVSEEKLSLRDEQKVSLTTKPIASQSDEGRRWIAFAVAASIALLATGGWFYQKRLAEEELANRVDSWTWHTPYSEDAEPVEQSGVVWRTETVTRNVPITRMRTEQRTRQIPVHRKGKDSLEAVTQNYTVQVPYTENVTQSGTVQVPYSADGKRIAAADYGKYGITADSPPESPAGGEVPTIFPNTEEWLAEKDSRTKYTDVAMGGGLGGGAITESEGITDADFNKLVELIQQTVASESWSENGGSDATIQSFPPSLSLVVKNSQRLASDADRSLQGEIFEQFGGVRSSTVPSFHRQELAANANQPSVGRININTMSSEELYFGLSHGTEGRESPLRGPSLLTESLAQNDRRASLWIDIGLPNQETSTLFSSLRQQERKLAEQYGENHPELVETRKALEKFAKIDSPEGISGRVWEMQQQRLLHRADQSPNRRGTQVAAVKMRLLEAKADAELVLAQVGNGHPNYKVAMVRLEIIEKQLADIEEEAANTSLSVEELPDEVFLANHLRGLKKKLDKLAKEKSKPKSWKRVKAIPNTTRLMVGDKEELTLNGMQVNAQVDGFRARVLVDYFYYNDRERQLEGNFKLRLPDDASLYYFAFGESAYEYSPEGKLAAEEFLNDGTQFVSLGVQDVKRARKGQWDNVKESRMIPKEKAAHAFRETVRRRVDPALVEWSGAGVFNAKVFPLAPKKLHRIVVGYDVNLRRTKDGLKYELNLPEQTGECRVEINVHDAKGVSYSVTPEADPIPTAIDGKMKKRFVFNNEEKQLESIELSVKGTNESVLQSSNDEGDFWTLQTTPDLPVENGSANSRAIFMVDTSLSTSPDKFNVWLNMLEATLSNNRGSLEEFGVLFFNVDQHFWKNQYVANTPENVAELKKTLENLALEGATDLYGAVHAVAEADWVGSHDNRPNLFLLSDGAATWGETDLRLINELLRQPQLGSLFAYQTGLTGTSISGLRFLAGQSGGAVFSVATEDEIKTASTAHRKRPWKLKSIAAAGASDILTAGRVQWVYPGQTITIVGRGNVDETVELEFQQGNESRTVSLRPATIESALASRMYGHVAVGQLESLGSQVFDVSAAYARHFRITGKTCSLMMLESEADYERFDIKPQEDLFVVKSKATSKLVSETLEKFAEQLNDPKEKLFAWLQRLESMPGMEFEIPTALKLAMDDIEVEAISQPTNCTLTMKDGLSESYLKALAFEQLDYDSISAEANRRMAASSADASVDDTLKVYSSLVERNPGDIVVARDVAFTALELERPATAFHLLRRVAKARPFQGNVYPAIGQCLAQLGKGDMAIVYYEIAMNGTFQRQGGEFKQIVAAEYIHLLRQIVSGKLKSSVKDFAAARLETLGKHLPFGTADVVITMMWNQDQTDVDMHVVEPSGEECSYEHTKTRSGGQITTDIRTGFGPEMYYNANAPRGKYELKAKFFGSGQNRTSTRNKVYMTVIKGFGTDDESMTRRTIQLDKVGEKVPVMSLGIE